MLKIRAKILLLTSLLFWQSLSAQNADNRLFAGPSDDYIRKEHSQSQREDFTLVDKYVLTMPDDVFTALPDLTAYLTGKYSDSKSKVRSIYTWIAVNIEYDHQAHLIKDENDQKVGKVWKDRKAVCEGYANLFTEMCRLAGIESRVIIGYVREADGRPLKYPNHAWNSVMIDGKWHLLDVTWASLQWQQDGEDFTNAVDRFFLPDPEGMIYSHLPEDPYWQLHDRYVNLEQFENGIEAINQALSVSTDEKKNFEQMIVSYESLDSLDRIITLLERQEENRWNKSREYNLGIAYFYKAQQIISETGHLATGAGKKAKMIAKEFYEKSLNYLSQIEERDRGYEFSRALSDNVSFRIEILQ